MVEAAGVERACQRVPRRRALLGGERRGDALAEAGADGAVGVLDEGHTVSRESLNFDMISQVVLPWRQGAVSTEVQAVVDAAQHDIAAVVPALVALRTNPPPQASGVQEAIERASEFQLNWIRDVFLAADPDHYSWLNGGLMLIRPSAPLHAEGLAVLGVHARRRHGRRR